MKLIVLLTCVIALAIAEDKYEEVENNFNIDELLENERLLVPYIKCLLNKGPCTPDLKKIKEKLPEALETNCAKCTDKQKEMGRVLVTKVKKSYPKMWEELKALYDPQGKYQQVFQEFLAGKSARETFREINGVLGDGTLSLRTAEEWFRRFRAGENDTMDKPAGGRPVTTNTDQIMDYIELDRHVASRDIAQEMGVSHQTILNHLQKAGYKKNLTTLYNIYRNFFYVKPIRTLQGNLLLFLLKWLHSSRGIVLL